jgi:hypothetical protein
MSINPLKVGGGGDRRTIRLNDRPYVALQHSHHCLVGTDSVFLGSRR